MEIKEIFEKINLLWKEKDFISVAETCEEIINRGDAKEQEKAYALIRKAHAYEKMGDKEKTKQSLKKVVGSFTFPQTFRFEATEKLKELDGLNKSQNSEKLIKDYTPAYEIYVSAKGDDNNNGSKDALFATVKKANEFVRKLAEGPVQINIEEGIYFIDEALTFTSEDGGERGKPVIYKGIGNVFFTGGKTIGGFKLLTDERVLAKIPEKSRGKVYECDLKKFGIKDFGELAVRGYAATPPTNTFEIFVNNKAQRMVRYPKEGFWDVDNLIQNGDIYKDEPSIFEYKDPKFEAWDLKDVWLFGYFRFLWADRALKVRGIDPKTKQLIMEPYHWTDGDEMNPDGMGNDQGIVYYAFNVLEEISEPGEYYLDRDKGIIYLYPDCDLSEATVTVNTLTDTMVKIKDTGNIRFENIHFDLGRNCGFEIENSSNIEIIGCKISRFASEAVKAENVSNITVFGCEICDLGRSGVILFGGDRETLEPANNLVENCKIHNFGRIDRTYTPAILLNGVGMKAAHNEIYNGPSSAMRVEGNEMIIEYNDFHDLLQESDDQGVIDIYQDFSYRNQFYRYNYFHDNGMAGRKQVAGQGAIRFDDAISGMLVYGNIIERSATGGFGGVQINSGMDNVMDNNIFIECDSAFSGGYHPLNSVWRWLRENRLPEGIILNDLYFERYPELKNVYNNVGVNYYWRNIVVKCKRMFPEGRLMVNAPMIDGEVDLTEKIKDLMFNVVENDRDIIGEDYQVKEEIDSLLTFNQIPFKNIGTYQSNNRIF
ncbi:MAG: right-handed parallel beta-helix repeat-containing protein [Abditibacteriota bacterium]|nr:right-handed parallel beta-helix repeat-containing protein [Abditibacteriota bacterium]